MAEARPSSTHPPLPPTTEEDRLDHLRLLRSRRVGIATYWRLLAEHGSAAAALAALPEVARAAGMDNYAPCPKEVALSELRQGQALGATLLMHRDPHYPTMLADVADAPPLLWAKGRLDLARLPMVALVGARNASSLGLRMTTRLARELGMAGQIIVSGLARGIDTAAHLAALDSGTIAVLAGGIDGIYPPENAGLMHRIGETGLLLSEQPPGTEAQARHFPARNRIVSALARAVIVVEAAHKSGSLITARNALDQGREVMAVPGHPLDPRAAGCNLLLRDGAVLVRTAADVLEALGAAEALPARPDDEALPDRAPGLAVAGRSATATNYTVSAPQYDMTSAPQALTQPLRDSSALHMQILSRLGPAPVAEDQLIRDLAAPARAVMPLLTELELDGRISRTAGGMVARIV